MNINLNYEIKFKKEQDQSLDLMDIVNAQHAYESFDILKVLMPLNISCCFTE